MWTSIFLFQWLAPPIQRLVDDLPPISEDPSSNELPTQECNQNASPQVS